MDGSGILAGMTKSLPLSLIAALGENRVIGVDNSMPWHLPGDFKYFKATTLGKPIIMGRKTWDSLGRPLPGRLNIVVSRQADLVLEGAEVYPSLEAAVVRAEEWAKEQGVDEVMLIGGAQLYAQGLAQADRLYLTRVALSPEGDAWFPEFDLKPVEVGVQYPESGGRRQAGVQLRGVGKGLKASRASSLPQWVCGEYTDCVNTTIPVGAELARDEASSGAEDLSLSQLRMLIRIQQRFIRLLHDLAGNRPGRDRTTHVQRRTTHINQRLNRNQQRHQ